jgi:hypothetical protein
MKAIFDRIVHLLVWLTLALVAVALVDFLLHPLAGDYNFHSPLFRAIVILVFTPLNLLVGFLIIRRVPGNVVGPLLIVWSGTVVYGSIREDISPLLFSAFYYYDLAFGWIALFLMLVHFPDGTIRPPGAAPWLYRLLTFYILPLSLLFLSTEHFQIPSRLLNPFYLPALGSQAGFFLQVGLLFLYPVLVLALISPALRYRRGSLQERQQIKWLALFGGFLVIYVLLGLIVYPILTGGEVMNAGTGWIAVSFYAITGIIPPLAIGFAVLRYRLWEIDLLIRRTLVYSILTVFLALIYFGSVVTLEGISQLITRQQGSPAVTVLSTLAIAALFTPLRSRIQERIDRRFYRHKYDSEQVLSAFSATLKEEVDIEHLTDSIQGVAIKTMHPANVSIWLYRDHPLARPPQQLGM